MSDTAGTRLARVARLVVPANSAAAIAAAFLATLAASACRTHVHDLASCREGILRDRWSRNDARSKASEKCEYYLLCEGVAALPEVCKIYRETGDGFWLKGFLSTLQEIEERKASQVFDFTAVAEEIDDIDAALASRALLRIKLDPFESSFIWNPAMAYEERFGEGTWPPDIPVESFGTFGR